MNAQALKPKGIIALLKETCTEWSKDNCMRLGAALAYYSVFSAAPLVMIAIGIVGAIYGPEAAQGKVSGQLSSVVGWEVAKAVEDLVASASKTSKGATLVGIVTLLFGASTVFAQLKEALNTIWEVKPKPGRGIWGFIRSRLLTFGIVLVIGFLMLASLILTTLITAMNSYIEQKFGIPPAVSNLLAIVVPFAVEVLLFAMIFKLLPDAKVLWKNVWVGAVVTAVLFEIGKVLLSLYFKYAGAASAFGAAGSLVLLLLWVYYTSLILFFGAEFTEVWARATGHVIEPKENAMKVTPEERVNEGLEPDIVPHPSAAAAMAGRDPNTGVQSSGGNTGPVRVEPNPVMGHGRSANRPPKERLAPLRAEAEASSFPADELRSTEAVRETEHEGLVQSANQHPLAELGAALSLGLVMGLVSRFTEGRSRRMTAGEHLSIGAKAAAIAGATALAKLGPRLARRVDKRAVKRTARKTAERVRDFGQQLPRKVEDVLK